MLFYILIIFSSLSLHSGDIIFQDGSSNDFNDAIKNNDFNDAIKNVTKNDSIYSFSHCGIIYKENNNDSIAFVIEANTPDGVVMTPLDSFVARSNKIMIARLDDSLQYIIPKVIVKVKKLIGKEYDYAFDFYNDKYYCSELIYFTYLDKNDKPIFSSNPMTFVDPNTNKTDSNWVKYFDKLNITIPEGKEGCNPNGLYKSSFLKVIN